MEVYFCLHSHDIFQEKLRYERDVLEARKVNIYDGFVFKGFLYK
jgi:hypothetical protein